MTKINHKEYEILKGLNDGWKWIAKDKNTSLWVYEKEPRKCEDCWDEFVGTCEMIDSPLFQFIQWEDEEPYSIYELIEEYLDDEYGYFNMKLSREFEEFVEIEREEAGVKDLEWLKKWVEEYENEIIKELENNPADDFITTRLHGGQSAVKEIKHRINQLDESEVLSQELPVIPQFVADFLEKFNAIYDSCVRYLVEAHNGDLYYLNDMMVEDGNLTLDEATELCEWAEKQKQSDLLKLINGYTVEKEQQFYARIKGWENVTTGSEAFNWVYFKEEDTVGISKAVENKYQSASFTKYEWNNLGINEHNADFVSVEEVE